MSTYLSKFSHWLSWLFDTVSHYMFNHSIVYGLLLSSAGNWTTKWLI